MLMKQSAELMRGRTEEQCQGREERGVARFLFLKIPPIGLLEEIIVRNDCYLT